MSRYVLVRFGRWEDVLARSLPTGLVSVAAALWAKAVALAARGRVAEAQEAERSFVSAVARVPSSRHVHMVPSALSFGVAAPMLRGAACSKGCASSRRSLFLHPP